MKRYALSAALVAILAVPSHASAFTVASHAGICDIVYRDVKDDGKVTFRTTSGKTIHVAVSEDVKNAVTSGGGRYFLGGCMGPDSQPDTLTGQYYIHDDQSAKGFFAFHQWTRHLLSKAWVNRRRDPSALGFALGFIGHGIGDGFMHHFVDSVNCHGGAAALKRDPNCGAWNFSKGSGAYGKLTEEVKHLAVETFVNKHLFGKKIFNILVPAKFVVDNLVRTRTALRQYQGAMPTGKFYKMLLDWQAFTRQKARSGNWLISWFFKGRAEATERALHDWVNTWGNKIMGHLQNGRPNKITSELSDWFHRNRHMFYPDIWPPVLRAIGRAIETILLAPFRLIKEAIKKLIKLALKPLIDAVKEMASRYYYRWFDNTLFRDGGKMRNRLLKQMGNIRQGTQLSYADIEVQGKFHPAFNAIVLTKLMLLDSRGLSSLSRQLGKRIQGLSRNSRPATILDGAIAKLDDSNQLWSTSHAGKPRKVRMLLFQRANWPVADELFKGQTSTYFTYEWKSNAHVKHGDKNEQFAGNTSGISDLFSPKKIIKAILDKLLSPGKMVIDWMKKTGKKIGNAFKQAGKVVGDTLGVTKPPASNKPKAGQVWLGTAPFCGASPSDCRKKGMRYIRKDKRGYGPRCVSGYKVLCQGDPRGPSQVWLGKAPFCGASKSDCAKKGMVYVRRSKTGGGHRCVTGYKVLCKRRSSTKARTTTTRRGRTTGTRVTVRGRRSTKRTVWFGTAPWCRASARDCTRRGMRYLKRSKTGNGSRCLRGYKVLCQSR